MHSFLLFWNVFTFFYTTTIIQLYYTEPPWKRHSSIWLLQENICWSTYHRVRRLFLPLFIISSTDCKPGHCSSRENLFDCNTTPSTTWTSQVEAEIHDEFLLMGLGTVTHCCPLKTKVKVNKKGDWLWPPWNQGQGNLLWSPWNQGQGHQDLHYSHSWPQTSTRR